MYPVKKLPYWQLFFLERYVVYLKIILVKIVYFLITNEETGTVIYNILLFFIKNFHFIIYSLLNWCNICLACFNSSHI